MNTYLKIRFKYGSCQHGVLGGVVCGLWGFVFSFVPARLFNALQVSHVQSPLLCRRWECYTRACRRLAADWSAARRGRYWEALCSDSSGGPGDSDRLSWRATGCSQIAPGTRHLVGFVGDVAKLGLARCVGANEHVAHRSSGDRFVQPLALRAQLLWPNMPPAAITGTGTGKSEPWAH